MARALAAAIVISLLAVSGAGGSGVQTPKRGGTVHFGAGGEPPCLNPLSCMFLLVTRTVLTPALALAPDSTWKPRLASATFTKKPPFTITYHIRREARWSDGVPVTARDFVFTHNAIRKLVPTDPAFNIHDIHERVETIHQLDARTVRVVLRSREAGWRNLFNTVLPSHALRGENLENVWSDDINNPKTGKPIGSGPFLVESWERGKQLTLVRNRNYWGPHVAYLDRLVLRFEQRRGGSLPSELLELLRQGELDFASTRDPTIVADLRRAPGVRFVYTTTLSWEHIDIRTRVGGHPALQGSKGKRVRRAIAYAINRVAIARELFGELDPRYPPSDSAVFLRNHDSYRPNWAVYRHRPAESRRLLRLAGCRLGADGIYVCAGRRLELRLATTAGQRVRERTIKLVQAQLRKAGIDATLDFIPGPALFSQVLPSGDFDLAFFTWNGHGEFGWKDLFGCGGVLNYSGYCQRLVTKDLDQADRILDPEDRGRVLNRADRQLARDVPVIPLYELPMVLAIRKTVRNVVVAPANFLWNVEGWWLDD